MERRKKKVSRILLFASAFLVLGKLIEKLNREVDDDDDEEEKSVWNWEISLKPRLTLGRQGELSLINIHFQGLLDRKTRRRRAGHSSSNCLLISRWATFPPLFPVAGDEKQFQARGQVDKFRSLYSLLLMRRSFDGGGRGWARQGVSGGIRGLISFVSAVEMLSKWCEIWFK